MAGIQRFEEIEAWQTARVLTGKIYQLSNQGSFAKDYGLRDQMRRAAVSILSNISEGFESRTHPMFIEYLGRAKGSVGELRAQIYIASDLQYISKADFQELLEMTTKCGAQIYRFMEYLKHQPTMSKVREDGPNYEA